MAYRGVVLILLLICVVSALSLVVGADNEKDESSECSANSGGDAADKCDAQTPFASLSNSDDKVHKVVECPVVKKRLLDGQVLVGYVRGSRAVGGRCRPPSAQMLHAAIEGPQGRAAKGAMRECPSVEKTLAENGERHQGFTIDLTRGECRPPGWRSAEQMMLTPCPEFKAELPNGQKLIGYIVTFHAGSENGKGAGAEACRVPPTTTYADKQRAWENAQKTAKGKP